MEETSRIRFNIEHHNENSFALIDDSPSHMTYGELIAFSMQFADAVGKRCVILVLVRNCIGSAAGYLASLYGGMVPFLIGADTKWELMQVLVEKYMPQYVWCPDDIMLEFDSKWVDVYAGYKYVLKKTQYENYPIHSDLSLLLSTSGSTGSPKLVRHSYENLNAQVRNISQIFDINVEERAMVDLPIQYTYGLSVLNSHIYSGGTVLLSNLSLLDLEYWDFFKEYKATSFTNVPYAYEMLKRIGFFDMHLPFLQTLSQGGGGIDGHLQIEFTQYAKSTGKKFIITYGQTEGSARMTYLPMEYVGEKIGSIGRALPNRHIELVDERGNKIDKPNKVGEMIYKGANVTMGYAECKEDLLKGDERHGILFTGDMAYRDKEGFLYLVGRKARFVKINGTRIGLDECEKIARRVIGGECVCTGDDAKITFYVTDKGVDIDAINKISSIIKVNARTLDLKYISKIPRNPAGKVLYEKLCVEGETRGMGEKIYDE